jgi:hypothetical protein
MACNLIAPLVFRNFAQGNTDNVKSMVDAYRAYTALSLYVALNIHDQAESHME